MAGIRLDDGTLETPSKGFGKGMRRILFAPGCVTDARLPNVQARITTLYGPVSVSWANASNTLHMDIVVPPDATARVVVPPHVGGGPQHVAISEAQGGLFWANGKHAHALDGIEGKHVDGAVSIYVGSGSYSFQAK